MALDPSIALQVRPPQVNVDIPSPLDSAGRALSLQGLMQQTQLRNMQMQEAQRGIQDEQSLRDLFAPGAATPTTTDLIRAGGQRGLAVSKALLDQKTAELAQHKTILEDADLTRKAIEKTLGTATDNATKNQAIGEAVTKKWLTPEQASPLLNYDINDEGWKSYVSRIQQQTMDLGQRIDAAKKQLDLENAKHEETRKQAGFDVELPGKKADSAKKVLDAAQTQRAQDAAMLATAFEHSPETGAAAVAALAAGAPDRATPFRGAKTAAEVRRIGLTAEQQQTAAQNAAGTEVADLNVNGKPHKVLINKQTGQVVQDLGEAGYKPTELNANAAASLLDRESTRFAKPHEKSVAEANSQLEKINEARAMINGPATAQALGIPKVLVALVGGQGSGVRITQAELNSIAKARGIGGDVEGFIRKVSGGGTLTPEQQKQLTGLLDDTAARVRQKQAIANDALDRINSAGTREEIIAVDREMRQRLADMEKGGAGAAPAGKTISGLPRQPGAPAAAPPRATSGRTVMMIAPDGSGQDVPIEQVEWYKSKGAKVWE